METKHPCRCPIRTDRGGRTPFRHPRDNRRRGGDQYAKRKTRTNGEKLRGDPGVSPTPGIPAMGTNVGKRQKLSQDPDHPRHIWLNAFLQNGRVNLYPVVFIY
jgi:hypothetical protein